ncbi:hypothetical protein OH76DRAFT_994706 [Lentinus brumalis]|uniref:Uncharacterized protein n=1 Tax=Lentinus brumalis TaxID=2498619 RepID=A0A371DQD4_9APHY|nr:hypothetical protein OH76DRAFT_994706 [Polyporus brumalis]
MFLFASPTVRRRPPCCKKFQILGGHEWLRYAQWGSQYVSDDHLVQVLSYTSVCSRRMSMSSMPTTSPPRSLASIHPTPPTDRPRARLMLGELMAYAGTNQCCSPPLCSGTAVIRASVPESLDSQVLATMVIEPDGEKSEVGIYEPGHQSTGAVQVPDPAAQRGCEGAYLARVDPSSSSRFMAFVAMAYLSWFG